MLNTGREYAKAGIIIDDVTMEKIVIVTGGKGGWSGGSLDSTELLMDNQWTAGNSSKEILDFVLDLQQKLLLMDLRLKPLEMSTKWILTKRVF